MRNWGLQHRPRLDIVEGIKTFVIWTCGAIEAAILLAMVFVLVWLALLSASKPSLSHDFYPPECCSGKDCAPLPASRVDLVAGGYLIDRLHFVPEGLARVSPDKQFHGCFPVPNGVIQCFFAPKPSM